MIAPLGAKRHKKALARLEALQELLGLFHDTTVASAWLLSYAETSAAPPRTMLAAGALIQSLDSRERKLRRQCTRAWRRLERSDAIRDTLAEIRRAGRLALMPVSAPAPAAAADAGESALPNQSQIARRETEDAPQSEDPPQSNDNSMNSQSATETIP